MTHIYQWKFRLVSQSPLRIGDGDLDIMLDQEGKPFLPGTSWAGACRAYVEQNYGPKKAKELFGDVEKRQNQRNLFFSDGICETEQPIDIRTGISIDGLTGTNKKGHLFERITLSPGVVFLVTLKYQSQSAEKEYDDEYFGMICNVLHAIHQGEIRIGAYKSIGGGKFIIEDCEYIHFDCSIEHHLLAYINNDYSMKNIWKFNDRFKQSSSVKIRLMGETATPLLIGAQHSNDSREPDRTYITALYNGKPHPIIPASSIKGVLRHQVEKIANILDLKDKNKYITNLFGSSKESLIKQKGNLLIEDVILHSDINQSAKTYYRIAINPLTGGVKDGALLNESTILGSFDTCLTLSITNGYKEQDNVCLALLLFAIRDLAMERITLGSGFAIGRGYLKISTIEIKAKEHEVIIDMENKKIQDQSNWLTELQNSLQNKRAGGVNV